MTSQYCVPLVRENGVKPLADTMPKVPDAVRSVANVSRLDPGDPALSENNDRLNVPAKLLSSTAMTFTCAWVML